MKTSREWWNEIKDDETKFNDWLVRQYRGEVTAATRIFAAADLTDDTRAKSVLSAIAMQEQKHAAWVKLLLDDRGILVDEFEVLDAEKRYWEPVKRVIKNFDTAMAVGAHAENMRLERIRVIAEDDTAPQDVRDVFSLILKDEIWHEQAFRKLSNAEALEATRDAHEEGRRLLGLEA